MTARITWHLHSLDPLDECLLGVSRLGSLLNPGRLTFTSHPTSLDGLRSYAHVLVVLTGRLILLTKVVRKVTHQVPLVTEGASHGSFLEASISMHCITVQGTQA